MIPLIKQPFIGQEVQIMKSKNATQEGMKGTVIDETRERLTLQTNKGRRSVDKKSVQLRFKKEGQVYDIEGSLIAKTPEERIKIKVNA